MGKWTRPVNHTGDNMLFGAVIINGTVIAATQHSWGGGVEMENRIISWKKKLLASNNFKNEKNMEKANAGQYRGKGTCMKEK